MVETHSSQVLNLPQTLTDRLVIYKEKDDIQYEDILVG